MISYSSLNGFPPLRTLWQMPDLASTSKQWLICVPTGRCGRVYEPPTSFREDVGLVSLIHAKLLWCGLSVGTRRSYGPARRSYERYCTFEFPGQQAWPATLEKLMYSTPARDTPYKMGSNLEILYGVSRYAVGFAHGQSGQTQNFAPFKWTVVFANEHLKRLLDGTKLHVRRPITLPILESIVNPAPPSSTSLSMTQLDALRVDTAFKVAFAGFLRMGEFTYTKAELKDRVTLSKKTSAASRCQGKPVPRRFHPSSTHGLFYSSTCPVTALEALQRADAWPNGSPLFMLSSGYFVDETQGLSNLEEAIRKVET
ncbi:hypothetical protein V8E54_010741 [Elaphomyces granulatus]